MRTASVLVALSTFAMLVVLSNAQFPLPTIFPTILPTLPPSPTYPPAPQVGASGNPATVSQASIDDITALAANMYDRWYALDQACDPRAVFAIAYLYMTKNAVRLVQSNYFDDGNKMVQFITHFAGRYLTAYDLYAAGYTNISAPWLIAFNAGAGNHTDTTQDITLGMNAHINYDLAIVAYEQGYATSQWAADYYRVNDLMNQIGNNITAALGRYDALFYNQDFLSTTYFVASEQMVISWRSSAYGTALTYQNALTPAAVQLYQATAELVSATVAVPIATPYLYSTAASRRAYCATQNQNPLP